MEKKIKGRKGIPTIGMLNSQLIVVYSDSQMPIKMAKVLMTIMQPNIVGMYIVIDGIPIKQSALSRLWYWIKCCFILKSTVACRESNVSASLFYL